MIDASTGAAIEDFELKAHASSVAASESALDTGVPDGELLTRGIHAGGRVTLDGLTSWPRTLSIDAPGYRSWSQDWDGAPPEGRAVVRARLELTARLVVGCDIAGVVVDADGNTLPDVDVGLFEAGITRTGGEGRFLTDEQHWRIWPLPAQGLRFDELSITRTDAAGRFRFPDVPRGDVCVRAWRSPTIEAFADDVSIAGRELPELRLMMPRGHLVIGSIRIPEGAPSQLRMVAGQQVAARVPQALPAVALIAEDGTFQLGPFEPGEVTLFATDVDRWQPVDLLPKVHGSEVMACPIPLGNVMVPSDGGIEAPFDLGPAYPGSARVRVLVDAAPCEDATIMLCAADDHRFLHSAEIGEDGLADLGAVPPLAMEIWIKCHGKVPYWITLAPRRLVVESGRLAEEQVDITLVAGVASCLDAETGEPLQEGERIVVSQREPTGAARVIVMTDKQGRLNLRRPPGPFWLSRSMAKKLSGIRPTFTPWVDAQDPDAEASAVDGLPQNEAGQAIVEWPANGPAAVTVRL